MKTEETGVIATLKTAMPTLVQLAQINGISSEKAEALMAQEVEFLREAAMLNPKILQSAPASVLLAVKRAIKNNLTLDPQAGLMYIKTRAINVSQDANNPQWVTIMETQETCNGLLSKNRMLGRILDHNVPTVEFHADGKVKSVTFTFQKNTGNWETMTYSEYDFERWGNASHKERSRGKNDANTKDYRNALYSAWRGGIDPEFAKAKAIRHSLKKLGTNPNEKMATAIQISPAAFKVIAPEIANKEADDEIPNATSDAAATYHITTHEVVKLPADNTPLTETEELPFK
jgi:hypothetical protein